MPVKSFAYMSTDALKKRETLAKAVNALAGVFILVMIAYSIYLLASNKVRSVEDLTGRNGLSMGAFGVTLLLGKASLKKIKAELSRREEQEKIE